MNAINGVLQEYLGVNAAESATNLAVASKIAAVVNLLKSELQDIRVDLKPWMNEPETLDLVDPDSIDIGLHFPGLSRRFQSRSILIQIRFYDDPLLQSRRAIGVDASGFDHRGRCWRFSTVKNWGFDGETCPNCEAQDLFKRLCLSVFEVFNSTEEQDSDLAG